MAFVGGALRHLDPRLGYRPIPPRGTVSPAMIVVSVYQLAFFTPGMRPAEAISRNMMREMPNWRI